MAYKILFMDSGKGRREDWNNKTYTTKAGAQKQIASSVNTYRNSKYVKDVKPKNFKIVKVQARRTSVGFPRPAFRF
jgi:hypothetical protein